MGESWFFQQLQGGQCDRTVPGEVSAVGGAKSFRTWGPWPQAMGYYQKVLGKEGHNSCSYFTKMTGDCGQDEP